MIEKVNELKFKYGITHIFDCSKSYVNFNEDFFYESIKEEESEIENFALFFSSFCNFVQQAAKQKGNDHFFLN